MEMPAILGAQECIAAVLELAKAASAAAVDRKVKDRLIEVQAGILETQGVLAAAHAERLFLLSELQTVRDELREVKDSKAKLASYAMHAVEPGFIVYRSDGSHPVEHHACPRCFSQGAIGLLQVSPVASGQTRWQCSVCTFSAFTGTKRPLPPPSGRGGSWMSA